MYSRAILVRPAEVSHPLSRPNRNGSHEDHVMAKRQLPSPEVLRQLLRYEPDTGKLFWKERSRELFATQRHCSVWNTKYAGKEAFTSPDKQGYFRGKVFKKALKAHRVAWAISTGKWPTLDIDHINGNPSDNRIANLREATRSQNMRNKRVSSHNISGFKGVFWCKQRLKWRTNIRSDGKSIYVGHFDTPEDAHRAYAEAAAKIHGEFARVQ